MIEANGREFPGTSPVASQHLHRVERKHAAARPIISLQRLARVCLAIGTVLVICCGSPRCCPAQDLQPAASDSNWHFRYDLFQMLIEERGLRAVSELNVVLAAPSTSVIVMVGDPPSQLTNSDWQRMIDFVRGGGALLIATDQQFSIPGFGQFQSGPVTVSDRQLQYQGFADCLQLPVALAGRASLPRVGQIVSNRSGWFEPNPVSWLNWKSLVDLPQACSPSAARGKPLCALGSVAGQAAGVALVCADASLLSNGMLWHGDNAIAAIGMGEILCGEGKKTQVLFMADRRAMESYRSNADLSDSGAEPLPARQLPEPELDKALRLSNAILREVARTNVLNEALARQPRYLASHEYFRVALIACGLFLLVWLLRLLVRRPTRPELAVNTREMQAAFEIRGPLHSPTGDFRNAAGYLAREFCYELTGSTQSHDWQQFLLEHVSVGPQRRVSSADAVGRNLARIVDIACRGCHLSMNRKEFQQLGKTIQSLRRSLAGQHRL